jgi:hypothetical protein
MQVRRAHLGRLGLHRPYRKPVPLRSSNPCSRGTSMKRAVYIIAVVLLSGLAAFGAAELSLALGLGPEAAILAGLAAFFGNLFMIIVA